MTRKKYPTAILARILAIVTSLIILAGCGGGGGGGGGTPPALARGLGVR